MRKLLNAVTLLVGMLDISGKYKVICVSLEKIKVKVYVFEWSSDI